MELKKKRKRKIIKKGGLKNRALCLNSLLKTFYNHLFWCSLWMFHSICLICWETYAGNTNKGYNWSFVWFIILCLAAVGVAGYAVYKYRIRVLLIFPNLECCFGYSFIIILIKMNKIEKEKAKASYVIGSRWLINNLQKINMIFGLGQVLLDFAGTISKFVFDDWYLVVCVNLYTEIHGFRDKGDHGTVHAFG